MNLIGALKQQGIILQQIDQSLTTQQVKCDCPKDYCKKTRHNNYATPLTVELVLPDFAEWRCGHCLWADHIGTRPAAEEPRAAEVVKPLAASASASKRLPDDALAFLASRGIAEDEAAKYSIGYDGRRNAIKIPYLEGGNVINWTYVRITDGASKMESPDSSTLYGLPSVVLNDEPVTIAQRELDAIVLTERGIPNVVALPNGGDVMDKADDFNKEPDRFGYISRAAVSAKHWKSVRFALDDTKEGQALRTELARRFGPGRCTAAKMTRGSVWQTMAELGPDELCTDINEAASLPILGLFSVDDFENELKDYFEHGMASGVSTGWKNVDKVYTVVPGQLTVITGIPNSGKSEWVDALTFNLALNEGWRFAAFSPENGKEAHTIKLVEKRVEMSADPKSWKRMSYDTMMSGAEWVKHHYYFIESKDVMPTLDWILEKAKDAALRYGIKGLIIDPWNRIEKQLNNKSETDYVAECLPKILRFAANQGIHVWLVVHPKQQQKDHKTGKIPAPSLYDMAGSAHFVNMADNGIVIHRSDSVDDTTEVLVRKVRFKHVGRRGEAKLKYIRQTGRYEPLDEEVQQELDEAAEQYRAHSRGDIDAIRTYEVD